MLLALSVLNLEPYSAINGYPAISLIAMKLNEDFILKLIHKKANRPLKVSEMVKLFGIPEPQRRELRNLVKHLAAKGSLIKLRGGRYGLPDEMSLICGILQGNSKGFGFVVPLKPEDGGDVYVNRSKIGEAMHQDRVIVRVESHGDKGGPEGRIIRILERNTLTLLGVYETFGREGWVRPMDDKYFHEIFVPASQSAKAKTGQVVLTEITAYPTKHQPPQGKITEVLGYSDDPEVELRAVFRKHSVRQEFPPKALDQADRAKLPEMAPDAVKRRDLTDWLIFTIDGEKAKDFDDAVSLERLENGFRLGVHIADVSHFVTEDSPLDKEAYERGTSIYFPDGVIPMLPFQLSNELCSLKSGVPRRTLSVLIDFSDSGKVKQVDIFPSLINSKKRFTYTGVARLLSKGDPGGAYEDFMKTLKSMNALRKILRTNRFKSGSVDFNVPEAEIAVDQKGRVQSIGVAEHNVAHEIIEEFMLAANQEVARFLWEKEVPSIHRVHEPPDQDKLADFNEFIGSFGARLRSVRNVKSTDLQNLVKRVENKPEGRVINTLLLRTMKKAQYSVEDPGHFCLGFEHYTHFTSPIRRYPDLIIHRLVKTFLKKKCAQKERKKLRPKIHDYAEQSTAMEGKAQSVEREIVDLRRVQYMADKVGKTFTGVIVSVTAFGFFVELAEVFVEGLVHISSLQDDYYIYIESEHKWQGQRKHRILKIGDRVKVRLAAVDIGLKRIDFAYLGTPD